MAQYTPNLGLKKPDGTDYVLVSDLNGNMDMLDSKMGNPASLNTVSRGTLVDAINETNQSTQHPPKIQTGTWWVWEAAQAKYVDTGVIADLSDTKTDCETATKNAQKAADKIDGMTVTASQLEEGAQPTASLDLKDDAYILRLGIPKGDTGATGSQGPQGQQGQQGLKGDTGATPEITIGTVTTGAPGTEAAATMTGTPEAPVLSLTIPRGDTGSLGALTVNGKAPDASGAVTLTAADVGARPGTWTPSAADVGAYPAGAVRTISVSLAAGAWTGSGPYTAVITQEGVTAQTDCRFELGASAALLAADISWETAEGTITLTAAAKPAGTISGTAVLMEVTG